MSGWLVGWFTASLTTILIGFWNETGGVRRRHQPVRTCVGSGCKGETCLRPAVPCHVARMQSLGSQLFQHQELTVCKQGTEQYVHDGQDAGVLDAAMVNKTEGGFLSVG